MSYIGTIVSLVAGVPSVADASGYGALSLVEVGSVISHTAIGDTHSDQNATLVKTGRTLHSNGAADGGVITVMVDGENLSDAGMALVVTANGKNVAHSFAFASPENTRYLQGIVRNLQTMTVDANTKAGLQFDIAVNTPVLTVDTPA